MRRVRKETAVEWYKRFILLKPPPKKAEVRHFCVRADGSTEQEAYERAYTELASQRNRFGGDEDAGLNVRRRPWDFDRMGDGDVGVYIGTIIGGWHTIITSYMSSGLSFGELLEAMASDRPPPINPHHAEVFDSLEEMTQVWELD